MRDEVLSFLEAVEPLRRRKDALALLPVFEEVTGYVPKLWGTMVGFGAYNYTYKSGHSGRWFATGFAPRKASMSIYIMPGYQDYSEILSRLGKHRHGKSCLYVNKLEDIDLDVLKELIAIGLKDLNGYWPIQPV